jgi:hypothetical protein
MAKQHVIANRQSALMVAVACYVAGSYLLWDAYEGRGRPKPWAFKLLPGA